MGKSKVLVVGGTGYIGKRIVSASLAQGHQTYVLQRPEIGLDIDKLVEIWEKLCGNKLQKISISEQDFISSMKDLDYASQVGVGHYYHIFYEGCLTNFEIKEEEEASKLYPEVEYTRMEAYLKLYT